MEMIKAKINGHEIEVPKGTSILTAAKSIGVNIPTLCYHPDVCATASCGICVVKVMSMGGKYIRACATAIEPNMDIVTHNSEINKVRRTTLELILSAHPDDCLTCPRNGNCELQNIAADFGLRNDRFDKIKQLFPIDDSTKSVVLNPEKCIKCGRCMVVCQEKQKVYALTFLNRGFNTVFAPSGDITLSKSPCVDCGQCAAHCPVGAIYEYDETQIVLNVLDHKDKYAVVQIAPAVRVALGEMFGFDVGANITGKIYAALRAMGFKAVFDSNFGADLTIMEEASEFVKRFVDKKGNIPMITTCCPAWVNYMEEYYPDMLSHFSTAKSPHAMVGAMSKTYYAEKMGIDPSKIFMVSIMPCTAKKNEITKNDHMKASGYQDVDVVLTTREFGRLIKQFGIDIKSIAEEKADSILGEYTGAGTIFGATGGVMEAALRTAYYLITKKKLDKVDFNAVRGLDDVKETSIDIDGNKVNIAVAHGLRNVASVLDKVRAAKEKGEPTPYHFIEVMACHGGCVSGGGQPYASIDDIRTKRAAGLYTEDKNCEIRCSYENEAIKKIYAEYLGEPLGEKSHRLLHTDYKGKAKYRE